MVTVGDETVLGEIAAVVNSRPHGMAYDGNGERGITDHIVAWKSGRLPQ